MFVLQWSQARFVGDKGFIVKSRMSCYCCLWWITGSGVFLPPCLTPLPHDITDGGMVNIDFFAVAV